MQDPESRSFRISLETSQLLPIPAVLSMMRTLPERRIRAQESIDSLKDMTEGTWAVRFRMARIQNEWTELSGFLLSGKRPG